MATSRTPGPSSPSPSTHAASPPHCTCCPLGAGSTSSPRPDSGQARGCPPAGREAPRYLVQTEPQGAKDKGSMRPSGAQLPYREDHPAHRRQGDPPPRLRGTQRRPASLTRVCTSSCRQNPQEKTALTKVASTDSPHPALPGAKPVLCALNPPGGSCRGLLSHHHHPP